MSETALRVAHSNAAPLRPVRRFNTPEASTEAPNGFSHFGAEVTSAFVGTGLTVAITALLLKFQTDKQTEQQEKLLDQQNKHAVDLLDLQTKNDEKMRAVEAGHNSELLEK